MHLDTITGRTLENSEASSL